MFALLASLLIAAAPCTTDDECSLLGSCIRGTCECQRGWTGATCGRADLAPLGYQNPSRASWGGRPVWDGARWQMLVTELANACPLILFQYNSQVVRAVSAGADAGDLISMWRRCCRPSATTRA